MSAEETAPDPQAETVRRPSGGAEETRIAPSGGGTAADAPVARIGRYELRGKLGQGAMGTVFRAFDTQLKRDVALKLVRLQPGESGELFQRFRREAEAAAKLRHPNLVAVFDLGEEGGQPFMTMELLEGGSLARLLGAKGGKLAPNDAIRLVRDVARGLECAHEKGIVHRDLKPENILLDGSVPKISDFGLAQSIAQEGSARLTIHGTILGTPMYMAPEQAEGDLERVNARSDIYALGAVLYEAATGRPAYPGTDPMKVLLDKIASDPPPPAGLGRDLSTIIMKAMARDPARRYATAKEFAEDLDRCLSGAAILARPDSPIEKSLRAMRRHRSLSVASTVVLGCLVIAGGAALRSRADRREQKRLEDEALRLLRSVAEANMHASLELRRNGLPVARQEPFFAGVQEAADQAIRRGPASPEPHYLLGRMHRALQRFDAALAEQDRAIAKDPAYAAARYERALLNLRRFEERLSERRAEWARDEGRRLAKEGDVKSVGRPPPPDTELAERDADASGLRRGILDDLAVLELRSAGSAEASCLRGMVQLHGATEHEIAEGAKRVEAALAADPLLEDAYEALATSAQARQKAGEATAWYTKGLEHDAGFIPFLLGRASVAGAEAERAMSFGDDPVPACRRAADDLGRALQLDPRLLEARLRRGKILRLWGDRLGESEADPEPTFTAALADLTAVVEGEPAKAEGWLFRGLVHATWGSWMQDHGKDPGAQDALAVADLDVGIRLGPQSAAAWGARGDVWRRWGLFEKNNGADPREKYAAALDDYSNALKLDARSVPLWTSRSSVRGAMSVFTRLRGDPWRGWLDDARSDLDRALELEPRSTWILGLRAQLDKLLGACQVQDGDDPAEVFGRAIADLDTLLRESPSARPLVERASIRVQWAERDQFLGRDPAPLLALARKDLEAAAKDPGSKEILGVELGRLEILEARRGGTEEHLKRALEALQSAIDLNASSTEAWMRLGVAGSVLGSWQAGVGQDPEPAWSAANSAFAKALAINSKWEDIWHERGLLWLERAVHHAERREPCAGAFKAALEDFRKVVEVNPAFVDGWRKLGETLRRMAELKLYDANLEDARAAVERAIHLGPNHAAARLERARARLAAGDPHGAREDLDWVEACVPAWKAEVESLRSR